MQQLHKKITVPQGVALAVGMVIGSGLLGLPGMAIEAAGNEVSLLGWMAVILLMVPMLLVFMRLGVKYATAAGLSKYAEVAVGKWGEYGVTAVLCGTFTIGIPALALIGGAYAAKLLELQGGIHVYWLAITFLVVSTILNVIGVRIASFVNTISLYLIVGLIALLVLTDVSLVASGVDVATRSVVNFPAYDVRQLWAVVALLFWAFLGWENMSFGLEEFKEPERNIPRVYWISFVIVSLVYIVLALLASGATARGVDVRGVAGLSGMIERSALNTPVLIVMVTVILANANSWVFGASRLIYSAGERGILPAYVGKLSTDGTPRASLISLCAFYVVFILIAMVLHTKVSSIVLMVSQNFLVLYAISVLAFWKVSEKKSGNLVLVALAAVSCAFLLSGFTWWLLYPAGLLALGYVMFLRKTRSMAHKPRPADV